jgi:hypothetical protein
MADAALKSFLSAAGASATLQASGLRPIDQELAGEPAIGELRRRRLRHRAQPGIGYLSLLQDQDGLLRWDLDSGPAARPLSAQARAGRRGLISLGIVEQFKFEMVHGSEVARFLDGLDTSFNAVRGLRGRSAAGADTGPAQPVATATKNGILLIVHGTFSKGDALVEGLNSTADGAKFLVDASRHYDQVLSFEHPTLSVSPILNALDLARALAGTTAPIDVVCHSRGGLVVRWWLEVLKAPQTTARRVVFVGSPLQGTSLASPMRLRTALNLMTNVLVGMQAAGQLASLAVPLFGVVAGLMKLISSVTGAAAKAPVVDAAVAMIPGLAAQSRRGLAGQQQILGSFELDRLSAGVSQLPGGYFAVKCNFEPTDPAWAFWKHFMRPGERLADLGADLVFPEANDLVVDTASMDALSDLVKVAGPNAVLDLGTSGVVHHLNYFAQQEVAKFIRASLAVP